LVPGKRHKYKWAKPDTLIIDDTLSVIEDWRKAGGIAIWHKDVPTTLAELQTYL
jgi:signal transduction histidine kinase